MIIDSAKLRTWVLVVVSSFFLYVFYWFVEPLLFGPVYFGQLYFLWAFLNPEPFYNWFVGFYGTRSHDLFVLYGIWHMFDSIAALIRLLAASYALICTYKIFRARWNAFSKVKALVSRALFFEALYYLFSVPFIAFAVLMQHYPLFAVSCILRISLISPLLIELSRRVRKYESGVVERGIWRFAGAACIGYFGAYFLFSYLARWVDLALRGELAGTNFYLCLNTVTILSLSFLFAVIGLYPILQSGKVNLRFCGISLILLSLHFMIYVILSLSAGEWWLTLQFVVYHSNDLWCISVLGIGLDFIRKHPGPATSVIVSSP